MEEFWKKNRRLNRPLSPHLSIYKPQITSMLSITHRITGAALTGAMYLGPIMYLCGSGDYQSYLALVNSWGALGTSMIWTVKTGLAFSFAYHLVNGVRHLAWDWAMGFKIKQVYSSGYTVMATSVLLTAALLIFI